MQRLPRTLDVLSLARNRLEGTLEFRNVPEALHYVETRGNNFDKETVVFDSPHKMCRFNIDGLPGVKIIGPTGA